MELVDDRLESFMGICDTELGESPIPLQAINSQHQTGVITFNVSMATRLISIRPSILG